MPVPYMGSKAGSASTILRVIRAYCPKATAIYDVFCGGFAISEEALKMGLDVYASDLNEAVVNLEREVLFGNCIDPKTGKSIFEEPRFISRQEFEALKDDESWFAGYVKCIWSFGNNNNKGYLYSSENEKLKSAAHHLIVFREPQESLPIPMAIQRKIAQLKTWEGRRKALGYYARQKTKKPPLRCQELERLRSLENLQRLRSPENLQRLRSLENRSYDDVSIEPGAIIYCDPPYINTATYVANKSTFDHRRFYEWCREKSKTNPVFVSEYQCPEDFKCIYEFERRQLLSKGDTKFNEKLFYIDNSKE